MTTIGFGNRTGRFGVLIPMRSLLAASAIVLLASACGGSNATTSTGTGEDTSAIEAPAPDGTDPTEPPVGDSAEPDDDGQATSSEAPAGDEPENSAEDDPVASAPPANVTREDAAANAAANEPGLVIAGSPDLTEVLLVADGSVTTLADAVTGDRPLLIWFWAPH